MSSEQCKGKGPQLLKQTPTEQVYDQDCQGGKGSFPLSIAAHVSKKRSSKVVEIHDSVDSPSRTLTILIKESNGSGALPRERSQKSGESISGPNPIKSPSTEKPKKEATSAPRDRVKSRLSSDLQKHPTTAVSVFDGKKIVLSYRKMFISELWTVIRGKLSGSDVDCVSSLKEEVQARSALYDKDMEAARKEFSITVGEVKEKIEKLCRKEKDLEILLDATKKEIEEAKLGVSIAEKDFDACNDAYLLNSDDLDDLEQKKERLKAMRQDLINYKLCLY
ncbi:hypothetical protein HAX54_014774 [Datura stramonium]|uniref:Uncharacterized protein n=1 Tax=Datura stramonium TaxID=4076 RepID=A0ABS8Y520_DATST|nr:hypothetical protein [Datura stramonium]